MHEDRKILLLVGGIFFGVGIFLFLIFALVMGFPWALFPLLFVILGAVLCAIPIVASSKEKKVWNEGKPYKAKICGYVDDTSIVVNGAYPVNARVRFFDENHAITETILKTRFARGNASFPIGATIDIRGLNGEYSFDPKSVRRERIDQEERLMDNRPVDTSEVTYIAISCPHCGASFQAMKGYTSQCPYCGSYLNS